MNDLAEKNIEKNPEVTEKATRRRFSNEYKQRILREADQCTLPGQLGALLRREGLYSSSLSRWRRKFQEDSLGTSKQAKHRESLAQENARLKRENERLQEKLRKAEIIIDVQKKVSEMIQTRSQEKND